MGDTNSPADDSGGPAHQEFLAAGFHDTWAAVRPSDPGYTAMAAAPFVNLGRPSFDATQRIDYVFTRGGFGADAMNIEGADSADRTPTGLWPSDHAAIVATLDLPQHSLEVDGAELEEIAQIGNESTTKSGGGTNAKTSDDSLGWSPLDMASPGLQDPLLP
jgi:hypothetical protein